MEKIKDLERQIEILKEDIKNKYKEVQDFSVDYFKTERAIKYIEDAKKEIRKIQRAIKKRKDKGLD